MNGLSPGHCSTAADIEAELVSMRRRFFAAAALSAPLVASMLFAGLSLPPLISAALAGLVVFGTGRPLLGRGLVSLRAGAPDMYLLISLGVLVAYGSSLALLLSGWPEAPLYFDTAALLTTLTLLGQTLELAARQRVERAIGKTEDLLPDTAHRLDAAGRLHDIPAAMLSTGDRVRVRPGETLPADGRVSEGQGMVDRAMLSGEPEPFPVHAGDMVLAGTVNQTGSFIMSVTAKGGDTVASSIEAAASSALSGRPRITRMADRVAAFFVPAVVAAASLTALMWWVLGGPQLMPLGLLSAISVVIIACPCALGLAAPMSITVGTGLGARAGVLFRDIEALENLGSVDVLVVDKTGTLTEGRPRVSSFVALDDNEERCLGLAVSVETASEHPFARALGELAAERGLVPSAPDDFRAYPGGGVEAIVEGTRVRVGSRSFVTADLRDSDRGGIEELDRRLERSLELNRGLPSSRIFVSLDGRPAAAASINDLPRASSPEAIDLLARSGLELVMASGDGQAVVDATADRLGIEVRHAGASPEDKARLVTELRSSGKRVAMAGDGINDAPALAAADVGVAMGSGAGLAIRNSAVTLVGSDLRAAAHAIRLSRATVGNIRQNLGFAFAYNLLALPLAAGLLYPLTGMTFDPVLASLAMSASSLSVIANALRLARLRL